MGARDIDELGGCIEPRASALWFKLRTCLVACRLSGNVGEGVDLRE